MCPTDESLPDVMDDDVMAQWEREDTEAFLAFLDALEADWRL